MAVEIMKENIPVVLSEEDYLDEIIDDLSEETIKRLNKHCHDEEESIPFNPII
ncbi:Uncharacterised protein [uncultured archaeon]|nr:Uncharacterised protein [uncultured archaeon]